MEQKFGTEAETEADFNLISEADVALIKIKLGKSHRKESDWEAIKEILLKHNVITAVPLKKDRRITVVDNILCQEHFLIVFTNVEDCRKYLAMLNLRHGVRDRNFELSALPFEAAVDAAERHRTNLYIDVQAEINAVFMYYVHGVRELRAARMAGNGL